MWVMALARWAMQWGLAGVRMVESLVGMVWEERK